MSLKRLPIQYVEFVQLFNAGEYWESHEVLEGPWREYRSRFYRGMIIYASAFVHGQRGNPRGVWNQLIKTERYLNEFKPYYMGVDLERLLRHVVTCKSIVDVETLARSGRVPPKDQALTAVIPFDRLVLHDRLIRGDEPELSQHMPE